MEVDTSEAVSLISRDKLLTLFPQIILSKTRLNCGLSHEKTSTGWYGSSKSVLQEAEKIFNIICNRESVF